MKEKICLIRGKMRKRNWININDIVVVSIREFEKEKGDIIHKYNSDESQTLKLLKKIPNIDVCNKKDSTEDVNFTYTSYTEMLESEVNTIKEIHPDSKPEEYYSFNYSSNNESEDELKM